MKKQSRKFAQTLQWKPSVTEKSPGTKHTHTLCHGNPHTPKQVTTEAAEIPKIKTVRLAHPQRHMKQFYIADRKKKKKNNQKTNKTNKKNKQKTGKTDKGCAN